jgi:hypothetical protein
MAGVVFDSTYLIDLFNPRLQGGRRAALDFLVAELSKTRTRILIPSPCLTELLVRAGTARDKYLQQLQSSSAFEVIPYDRRAATECALLLEAAWDVKNQKAVSRTKFKFDWMIVACAASRNVQRIYSDDGDILRCATQVPIQTVKQADLPVPSSARQLRIPDTD